METKVDDNGESVILRLDPETEFLYSKDVKTGNEWEMFKENVKPLKRGRKIGLLNESLKSHHTNLHLKNSLLQTRRRLIEAINEYKGEDPLQPWLECINWVQEAFPPGGDSSGLVVIYEKCVRSFWHEDRYKDDLRYLKVWLEYADNCLDAEVVYNFLEANNIGQTHSSFFISYALHMEAKDKMRTANEIFNRGLSRNAQPVEKLKDAFKKFLAHSMGRLNTRDDESTENLLPSRSFGTVLTSGARPNIESSGVSRKKLKQDRAQGSSLTIYKDTSDAGTGHQRESLKTDAKPWHVLGARAERNKENNVIPAKWTSAKIPRRAGTTSIPPAALRIEIFVDEECEDTHVGGGNSGKSSTLQCGHGDGQSLKRETELLRKNPLRNFPTSSLPR